MADIDVIVPCYNYGRFLPSCVGSVLAQEACTVRVLIIDDASPDGSAAVAHDLAARDSRVTVIAHSRNAGHIATYNEGIDWVRAETMLLLSADDLIAPRSVARALDVLRANPRVGYVHGRSVRFTDEAEIAAPAPCPDQPAQIEPGIEFIRARCEDPSNPVETPTVVVRTEMHRRLGGYRPELPHSGDLELWLRLAAHGDVGFVPAVQAYTRLHGQNMRRAYEADRMIGDYKQRDLAFRMFFDAHGLHVPGAADLRARALGRLAEAAAWHACRALEEAAPSDAARLAALAVEISPEVRGSGAWWRWRVRRVLGPLNRLTVSPAQRRSRAAG